MTPEQLSLLHSTNKIRHLDTAECNRLFAHIDQQAAEISRLRGIIDQHNLCHDLHGKVNADDFAKSCIAEQKQVYGRSPHEEEITRLRSTLTEALRQVGEILECGKGEDSQGRQVYRVQPGMIPNLAATIKAGFGAGEGRNK